MNRIAAFATVTVLAATAGSSAVAYATTSNPVPAHSTSAGAVAGGQSFIRSNGHVVALSSGDDHRGGPPKKHAEPGDDRGRSVRHAEPGDDRGDHAEPGDDRGRSVRHAEPGDDRGDHAEPGDDRGRH